MVNTDLPFQARPWVHRRRHIGNSSDACDTKLLHEVPNAANNGAQSLFTTGNETPKGEYCYQLHVVLQIQGF
jgi:hypothetical protein